MTNDNGDEKGMTEKESIPNTRRVSHVHQICHRHRARMNCHTTGAGTAEKATQKRGIMLFWIIWTTMMRMMMMIHRKRKNGGWSLLAHVSYTKDVIEIETETVTVTVTKIMCVHTWRRTKDRDDRDRDRDRDRVQQQKQKQWTRKNAHQPGRHNCYLSGLFQGIMGTGVLLKKNRHTTTTTTTNNDTNNNHKKEEEIEHFPLVIVTVIVIVIVIYTRWQ